MKNEDTIIINKKIIKAAGHHGGAWKVAYADFVTAMMAFFLLLWLLNVTTDEQRSGIADYFAPTTVSRSTGGSGGVMGGLTMASQGARVSDAAALTVVVELTPPPQRKPADEESEAEHDADNISENDLLERIAQREQESFRQAEHEIRQAIQDVPELAELAQHLLVDNTPEGLRIQLVDQDKRSMFPSGSAKMGQHTQQLMQKIAEVVARMPNQIVISGHTDATPFRNAKDYGNWELSADRANASRRALMDAGVPAARIARVVGKADTEPLVAEDPTLPTNRRISIVMLRDASALPSGGVSAEAPVLPPGGVSIKAEP